MRVSVSAHTRREATNMLAAMAGRELSALLDYVHTIVVGAPANVSLGFAVLSFDSPGHSEGMTARCRIRLFTAQHSVTNEVTVPLGDGCCEKVAWGIAEVLPELLGLHGFEVRMQARSR